MSGKTNKDGRVVFKTTLTLNQDESDLLKEVEMRLAVKAFAPSRAEILRVAVMRGLGIILDETIAMEQYRAQLKARGKDPFDVHSMYPEFHEAKIVTNNPEDPANEYVREDATDPTGPRVTNHQVQSTFLKDHVCICKPRPIEVDNENENKNEEENA